MRHRSRGYRWLRGEGLEIGALAHPAKPPANCRVHYCDAMPAEEAARLFPELDAKDLTPVEFISDLDAQGLRIFRDSEWDFVVLNHVIEHVANPIMVVNELFRVVRPGGVVVISAPDKHYTFDRKRALTSWDHLHSEYLDGVDTVSDEHLLDFLRGVHPEVYAHGEQSDAVRYALASVRLRREHVHVWDSATFRSFLEDAVALLGIQAHRHFESLAAENGIEYFSVWQKHPVSQAQRPGVLGRFVDRVAQRLRKLVATDGIKAGILVSYACRAGVGTHADPGTEGYFYSDPLWHLALYR